MTTPYLNATELSASQVDGYATSNELDRVIEKAICGRITVDFTSDADRILDVDTAAGTEEWRDKFITFTDTTALTAGRDVTFPSEEGPEYIIKNSTAQTLTLKISGQSGVTIATTVIGRYYYDGTDIVAGP
ncbi:MAG: hypothetical protein COB36_10795 [Alphaproteobacteria bacterium]|nr:MAG: hypothetical protein COB36_10795 [Alphaproteobacteria bacterium]